MSESFIYLISFLSVLSLLFYKTKGMINKLISAKIKEIESQISDSRKEMLEALNIVEELKGEKNKLISEENIEISEYLKEVERISQKEEVVISESIDKQISDAKIKLDELKNTRISEFKNIIIQKFLDTSKNLSKERPNRNEKFLISSIDGIEKVFIDNTKE